MGRLARFLDRWRLQKVQERWSRATAEAGAMDAFDLRAVRAEARGMRREIDRLIHAADQRLAQPGLGAGLPRQPLGTDWAWRPDAWRGSLPVPGAVAAEGRTPLGDDLALYHDCPLGEIALRQLRNLDKDDRAPFGLAIEVFGFRGSFLSLATNLPEAAASGLKKRHLIRLDLIVNGDQPVRGFARLNVKHGPSVAQLVSALPGQGREMVAEFDLAYGEIDDSRIERLWLDLIFNDPGNSRIILRDVVLSRRPRAEL